MPAPCTSDDFLGLVRQSGLLAETRLDSYLKKRREGAAPVQPADLARSLVRNGLLTDFQANQLLQGRSKGFLLGKYLILERLGSTRMSTVFLCQHKAMNRVVCVKVLSQDRAAEPALLQRFHREARAAASLSHPHIVRAHDFEETERGHLLVMEFVDGTSLERLIADHGPISPFRAAHYIYQAALGLHHAHEKGLVHRDVKPGNFMVDRTGTVKVLDLGLALFTNDEATQLTRAVLGSVDYLAPEQGMDSHAVDARADVYGLGATFWFLLTGTTPFSGVSMAERALAHRTRKLRPLDSLCPNAPAGLEAVLTKMMAKNPDERYASAAEVAEALAPFVDQPVAPPSEAEMPRLSRATRIAISPESPTGPSERAAVAAPLAGARQIPAESRQTPKGIRTVAVKSVSHSRKVAKVATEVAVERRQADGEQAQDKQAARRGFWRLFAAMAKAVARLLRA